MIADNTTTDIWWFSADFGYNLTTGEYFYCDFGYVFGGFDNAIEMAMSKLDRRLIDADVSQLAERVNYALDLLTIHV